MKRLDIWLGKTLFHPPIILLCHLTRQSQYAIHRALWFFAACHASYYMKSEGWGWAIFVWIWVGITFLDASIHPDREAKSHGFMRLLYWYSFMAGVVGFAIIGNLSSATPRALLILFAEYAATIKTVPPRRTREKRVSGRAVRA